MNAPFAPPRRGPRQAAVLLGFIVRFDKDRKFRDSLSDEAVDVLRKLVSGDVSEVVDKVWGFAWRGVVGWVGSVG
jgi:hypothetical protein